jgi:hypothetical protein
MPAFLMIAVVVLNVIIFIFGICSAVEMYVAYRRRPRPSLKPATVYDFPIRNSTHVHKRPAA